MKTRYGFILAAVLTGVGLSGTAHAERYVVVNGQRMTHAQIAHLERVSCRPLPNGAYWLNLRTGVWGYAGNSRAMGHIKDGCYRGRRRGRRRSLSERGLLYTPGDLNFR